MSIDRRNELREELSGYVVPYEILNNIIETTTVKTLTASDANSSLAVRASIINKVGNIMKSGKSSVKNFGELMNIVTHLGHEYDRERGYGYIIRMGKACGLDIFMLQEWTNIEEQALKATQ